MISQHGGNVYQIAASLNTNPENLLDFSCNANVFALEVTQRLVDVTPYPFQYYPDSRSKDLVQAIAMHEKIETDRIAVGNGAAELIWQTLQLLRPRHILFIGPIFSEYILACETLHIPYEILTPPPANEFQLGPKELELLWNTKADLVVICTPNNPAAITYQQFDSILNMLRAPRILIDNSYREFLFGDESYTENSIAFYLAAARPGVSIFTLHSFTKFFCCPGIRLGYLLGDKTPISSILSKRPSWSINPYNQLMGQLFLNHIDEYRNTLPALYNAVKATARELRRLECIQRKYVYEGPGFIACALQPTVNPADVYAALLRQHIIIRNCDNIPGMPPGYIRIQARPEQDMMQLITALQDIPVPAPRLRSTLLP